MHVTLCRMMHFEIVGRDRSTQLGELCAITSAIVRDKFIEFKKIVELMLLIFIVKIDIIDKYLN